MTLAFVRHGAVNVIDVGRELSLRSGGELREAVAEQVRNGERQFIFDFGATEFIDSAGLGALVSMAKLVHSVEGTVRLMRLNDDMRRLFELTKLDTLFDVVSASPASELVVPPAKEVRGPGIERSGQTN